MALDRLDYEQTVEQLRALAEVRFKLLAFVPTIAGAAVGLLSAPGSAAELVGIGALGLTATLGVFAYELRNSELRDAVVARAALLERELGFRSLSSTGPGGLFLERPRRPEPLWGVVPTWPGAGLALVYAAALGGWSYLLGWGALRAGDVGGARGLGALLGLATGAAVVAEVHRRAVRRAGPAGAAPPAGRPVRPAGR